jgi:hypothetical protein
MYFDGAFNLPGAGAGAILTSPVGDKLFLKGFAAKKTKIFLRKRTRKPRSNLGDVINERGR